MNEKKVYLASDNSSCAHPQIIEAVFQANQGFAPAYGSDVWTQQAEKLIQEAFHKKDCKVFLLSSGTGANVLALMLACRRHESVICTDIAHVQYQESGAAEAIVGCKLLTVPHKSGKATPENILNRLKHERAFGKHSTAPRVLSITQPTEIGTVYTLKELHLLSQLCKEEGLLFHMDGSRLYNAAVHLEASLEQIIEISSIDLLSLGGTKNGLMCAEALVIFNTALQMGCDHLHKQTLQLISKMRYLSAQYIAFFENKLWHSLAKQANQKAQQIAHLIKATPHLILSYPVETNQIFFTAPSSWISLIQEKIFCHLWDFEKNEIRFVTSWNTTNNDIDEVRSILSKLSE